MSEEDALGRFEDESVARGCPKTTVSIDNSEYQIMRLGSLFLLASSVGSLVEAFVVPLSPSAQSTRSPQSTIPRVPLWAKDDDDDDDGLIVENNGDPSRRNLVINTVAGGLLAACGVATWELYNLEVYTPSGFRRLATTQFLAALGDPTASQGTGAEVSDEWKKDRFIRVRAHKVLTPWTH